MRGIQRRRERQREDDLRQLMAEDWGRRIAHWVVFDMCGLQASSVDMGIKDGLCSALHAFHRQGAQGVGIDVHNEMQRLAPKQVLLMAEEQIRASQADLALEAQDTSAGDSQ
jgi:hypothetical protein